MRMKAPKEGSCDPIAPLELPHSLHAFHRVSQTDTLNMVSSCSVLYVYVCSCSCSLFYWNIDLFLAL